MLQAMFLLRHLDIQKRKQKNKKNKSTNNKTDYYDLRLNK